MTVKDNIGATPFLRILPPVALGIVLGTHSSLPVWALGALLAAAYLCALATRGIDSATGRACSFTALLLAAMFVARLSAHEKQIPEGQKVMLQLEVTDNPAIKGRWQTTTAYVGHWRDSSWHRCGEKIIFSADTCYPIAAGQRMICSAYVNSLGDASQSGYAALMNTRGIMGRAYLTPGNLAVRSPEDASPVRTWARKLQSAALERLARLEMAPAQAAIAATMAAGERRSLPTELRQSYSNTGTSHLLAVSGLHVGIVFILINCLLYPLCLLRRGHIIKNILAVAAIWAYAAMTGLSPSAMRAAFMFTGVQAALAAGLHRSSLNIVLATGTVMMMIEPGNLWDVSFQLSMLAVVAIVLMYRPIRSLIRCRNRALNLLWSSFAVGLAATLGTAPMVAYYFHSLPLVGLAVNPVVIATSHIVVLISLGWIIMPAGLLAGIAGWALSGVISVQNAIIEWSADLPGAWYRVDAGPWAVAGIYSAYLVIIAALWLRKKEKPFNPEMQ